jgi:hypothetical protein
MCLLRLFLLQNQGQRDSGCNEIKDKMPRLTKYGQSQRVGRIPSIKQQQEVMKGEYFRVFLSPMPRWSPEVLVKSALPLIEATDIQLVRGSNPHQLGQQIARAVYGGIGL